MIWSDEFDGNTLNLSRWHVKEGWFHAHAEYVHKWSIVGSNDVNNQKEYYHERNLEVRDGNLIITAKRERMGNQTYTSGGVTTKVPRLVYFNPLPLIHGTSQPVRCTF